MSINPIIFLGPPGTGKTTTLLDTVDQEMENGVPPDRIGFMTFTKRGVEEAVSRAAQRFGLPRSKFRYFNTLHSAAFRQLGLHTDNVFTGKQMQEFGKTHGLELHGGMSADDGTYSNFYGDDLILFFENLARITRIPIEQVLSENDYVIPDAERAWRVIKEFRHYKAEYGLFDFTDMIEEFIKQDDPPRLEVLIVDESQDLSELQWLMVDILSRYVKRKYVAGDDDQTIFTWAGASTRFITMPGDVRVLSQSHRVPNVVHGLANRVINKVFNRRLKSWRPRAAEGSYSTIEGISQLDPRSITTSNSVMMLGRTAKMLRSKFIPYCRGYGIPYTHFEYNGIKPSYAKAITAWNLLQNGKMIPFLDAFQIYNLLPTEGREEKGEKPGVRYGFKTRLKQNANNPEAPPISLLELQRDYGLLAQGTWQEVFTEIDPRDIQYIEKVISNGFNLLDKPKVHISTIHRVKGGQADTVIMLSDTPKAAERLKAGDQDEETRVFYTGLTRTFEDLVIVHPEKRYHFGGFFE